ncbi:uncharacterized protein LOC123473768 [Daphnia magna]|uniref:uncharacterized protein LOC123473768 n=1 Tax=Daphnia magna TaxID=35525 RepID=UPI001E1BD36F|nr:uncharacterized protein LOC123473768 [Daphnia magna]
MDCSSSTVCSRGRPKENHGYFNSYLKEAKRRRAERNDLDDRLDEEAAILSEEAAAITKEKSIFKNDVPVTTSAGVSHVSKMDVPIKAKNADVPSDNEMDISIVTSPIDDPHDDQMEVLIASAATTDDAPVEVTQGNMKCVTSNEHSCRKIRDCSRQPYLFLDKPQMITKTNKLMFGDINKAQSILKKQYPAIDGLFCCTIEGSLEFSRAQGEQWMQILYDGSDHWVLVSKGFTQPEHVLVYHSCPGKPWRKEHILSCMSSLFQTSNEKMTYIIKGCQRQSNGYDCGVFAIAFATSLAIGEDPATRLYDPIKLRPHLVNCLALGKITAFSIIPKSM